MLTRLVSLILSTTRSRGRKGENGKRLFNVLEDIVVTGVKGVCSVVEVFDALSGKSQV